MSRRCDRARERRLLAGVILASAAGNAWLVAQCAGTVEPMHLFLGSAILWSCLAPALLYLADPEHPPLPFMPLVGIYYGLAFGLPVFFPDVTQWGLSESIPPKVLLLLLGGMGALLLSYLGAGRSDLVRRIAPLRLPRDSSLPRLKAFLWLLLLCHLAWFFFPSMRALPSAATLLLPAGLLSFGMFLLLWKEGRLSRAEAAVLLLACLPLAFLSRLVSGLLSQVGILGIFLAVILWYATGRFPLLLTLLVLLFFALLQPVKGMYRQAVWWGGGDPSLGRMEKAGLLVTLGKEYYLGDGGIAAGEGEEGSVPSHILRRMGHLREFSVVVEETPGRVPYWKGESYASLPTKFVPRFLWPGKPREVLGGTFGHRYGFISPDDDSTAVSLSWIVEMYANFGVAGIFVGMSLCGVLFALLERFLNAPGMADLEFVTGASILFPLIWQEANFSSQAGRAIPQAFLLYALAHLCLRGRWGKGGGHRGEG